MDEITTLTNGALCTPELRLNAILELEDAMRPLAEEPEEATHLFVPWHYVRTVRVPAGQLAMGRMHKQPHWFFVLEGTASYLSEEGEGIVTAGAGKFAPAGIKRAVLALTDCVFMNIHKNDIFTSDVHSIEKHIYG
jgi:quercetin dioxygenase-like cupin family protein